MTQKPATKRSVVLMVVLAAISVVFLAIATRVGERRTQPRTKVPAPNLLMRALDWGSFRP